MANTYYVAATGADTNNGSIGSPWRTLQKAVDTAVAGDIIYLRGGTIGAGANCISKAGGTVANPITIQAYPGETPIITSVPTVGSNASLALINLELTGVWIIKGITFNSNGSAQRACIRVSSSNDSQIIGNVCDGGFIGIFTSNSQRLLVQGNICRNSTDQHGIYFGAGCANGVIRGNECYNNYWDGLHLNSSKATGVNDSNLIEGNRLHDNNLSGMDTEGCTNSIFRNNILYNNTKHGMTFHSQDQTAAGYPTDPCSNNLIVNNTITGNGLNGIQFRKEDTGGTVIFNNIILTASTTYGSISTDGATTSLTCDYNVVSDQFTTNLGASKITLAQWRTATGLDAHSVAATPTQLFNNPSAGDFTLKSTSPALDLGVPTFASKIPPATDITGLSRPRGSSYDAGAYELDTTPDTTPPVISGINATNSDIQATITWATNEASNSKVEYGLTTGYGSSSSVDPLYVTNHSIVLTGLTASTTYHYRVISVDAAGNSTASGDNTFTTSAPDVTPPVISGIAASPTVTTSTITWTTNEASDSQVEYGLTTSYGSSSALNSTKVTGHTVSLGGLTAGTTYHYRVLSRDASGNLAASADQTFATVVGGTIPSGYAARWLFDEASGTTTADASGNGQTGTLLNGPTFVATDRSGATGNVIVMDGVNDQVKVTRTALLEPASVSVAAWVKPNGTQAEWAIVVKKVHSNDNIEPYGSYGLHISPGGFAANTVGFQLGHTVSTTIASPSAITPNQWTHICGTYSPVSGVKKLYINGQLVTSASDTEAINYDKTTSGNLYMGQDPGTGEAFKGNIDEVTIWGRELTAAEVEAMATTGPGDTTAPTISSVASSGVTHQTATVTWVTNEAADTQVEYGTTTSYGSTTTLDTTKVTSHSASLTGLLASTLYHYRVKSRDAAGNLATGTDQTFTTSAAPDTTVPTATLSSAPNVTVGGTTTYDFTVAYSDNVAVDVSTIGTGDIVVTGPNAFSSNPAFVSVNIGTNGTPRTATYRLTPPGGTWTTDDNGTYTISLVTNQVRDTNSNAAAAGSLGTFTVNVDTVAPVLSAISATSIGANGATINWTSDEAADTQVEYGLTTAYGTSSTINDTATRVTSHSVALSGLTAFTTYHYRVKSRDAAGNLATGTDQTFTTLDNVVPTASLTSAPNVSAGNGTTYDLQVTYSDNAAINVASLGNGDIQVTGPNAFSSSPTFISVNNSANGTPRVATYRLVPPGGTWTTDDNGTYTIAMVANQVQDTNGNSVAAGTLGTFTVNVDTVPPSLTNVASSGVTYQAATISWTTNEAADSQVEYGTTTSYGSVSSLADTSPRVTSHSVNLSGLAASTTYHYRVKSTDAAGNLVIGTDMTFSTTAAPDTTAPTASLTSAPDVSSGLGSSYDFTVTYVDNVAIDVATLGTGDVVVSGPNAFNATPTFQGVNIGTNGTPRVATYRLTPPGGTWTTDDNGTYTIAMVANQVKDTSNNAVVSGVLGGFTVSVDTVAPVISGITSSGITHQVATISWTTNEISDTQVEYGTTAAYGTTTVLSDTSPRLTSHTVNLSGLAASTTYHYRVKSTDAAGNQTVSADQTFSTTAAPDATVPTATLIDAPDVTTGGGTTYSIQIEYQDDVSLDVSTIGTGDITVSGPGSFLATPSFVSVDNATNGQVRTATYQFTPPGGSWTTDDNGTYTISMVGNQVKDTSGNPVTDAVPTGTLGTFTVSVDTVAPVLSSIQSTGVLSTSATVSWTSDEAADTQVEYGTTAAYGSTTTLADTSPRVTSHSVNLSGLSSSTLYHYRVKSRDAAGNLATSSDRTFTTTAPPDLTAPTASLTLAPDVTTSGNSYDIKVTYSDNVAVDVASITTGDITVDGPNSFSAIPSMVSVNTAGNGTPRVATYRFTPPGGTWTTEDNGTYTISMAANQVKDTSGNWVAAGTLGTFAVSVDTVAPDISAIAASNITVQSATITWNTDEPASSQLDYGTTTSYGSSTPLDTTLVTSHSINLGGLQPGTTYHYRVRSTDSVGNTTISVDGTFSTDAVVDSTPPVISNVLVSNLTTSTATITWTTNEASNTQVEYGTTNAYGSQSTLNSSPVTSHTVTLTGLDHSTTYHFRVLSADAASNLATGSDLTFTTPILDTANPTAAAVLSNVALGGGGSYDFQVTYSDNVAINGSTLQTGNVVVSGPNSFNSAPVFLSVNTGGDGTPRTATYRLTPPGGSWSESDNGVYTLSMAANQVKDTSGNEVSSGTLATFSVNVDLTPPIAGTPEVTADGNAIVMTLSEPSAPFLGSGGFSLNGSLQASAEDWSISGTTLTLQLNGTVLQSEDNLLLSYNGAGGIIDASGNKMLAFSGRPVVNSSVQTAISLTAPTPVPVAAYQDRLFVVFATAQGVGTIQYKAQIALDHDGSPGDWSDGTDFSDSRSIVINNLESSTRYWVRIVTQDALGRTATGSVAIMSTNSLIFGQIPHVPDYVVRTEQRLMQQALHIFDSGQLNGIVDWVAIFKLTNRFARK